MDGKYGEPRSMMRTKTIARELALAVYKDAKDAIFKAKNFSKSPKMGIIDDPISIVEAWHLPSTEDSNDGRHFIGTDKGTILDEEWTWPRFPIYPFRFKDRPFGWYGVGIPEDIESQQKEVDYWNERIQQILNLATIRVWLERGSKINKEDLTNDPMPIGEYTGQPPAFTQDPGPPPDLFMERDRKKASAYEQIGLSQLFSASKKPAGISSGAGLREMKDTESERFQDVGQNWDDFWVFDVAYHGILDAAEDLARENKDFEIPIQMSGKMTSLKWKDISIDRKKLLVQPWPVSLLPRDPSGRIERVQELMGMFPQAAMALARFIDNPDVDAAISLVSAPMDAILSDMEAIEEGKEVTPEPFIDLAMAKMIGLSSYLKARNAGAPEEILDVYRYYLQCCHEMLQPAAPMGMEAPAAGPGMPAGAMPPEMQAMTGGGPPPGLIPPGVM